MRTWNINEPVFQSCFAIRLGGTRRQAFEWYCRKIGIDPKRNAPSDLDSSRSLATMFAKQGYKNFIIWFRDMPESPSATSVSLVAHEALHGTIHALNNSGFDGATDSNEETFTYYHDFVVREIYRRLWPVFKEKPRCKS